jgi:hypothetical protein
MIEKQDKNASNSVFILFLVVLCKQYDNINELFLKR